MDSSAWFPVFSVNTAHHCWLYPGLELFSAVRVFARSLANLLSLQDHCIWRRQPMATLCTTHSCFYYKEHTWTVMLILLCMLPGFEPFKFSAQITWYFVCNFPASYLLSCLFSINQYSIAFSNQINFLVSTSKQHGQDKHWILRTHIIVLKSQQTRRLIYLKSSFLTHLGQTLLST